MQQLAEHAPRVMRQVEAAHPLLAEILEGEQRPHARLGLLGDHDPSRRREALQAGRQVRGCAGHRTPVGAATREKVRNDHPSGGDPDPGR